MKKRTIFLLLIIGLTIIVTFGEYKYMKSLVAEEPLEKVYCTNRTIPAGDEISYEDIVIKYMKASDMEEAFVDGWDEGSKSYATSTLHKGTLLTKAHLQPVEMLVLASRSDKILVTFEFTTVTGNAWNLRVDQQVSLLFCSDEEASKLYEEVIISRVYDKNVLPSEESSLCEMRYVTFEMTREDGIELVRNRENGRVEILIL